MVGQHGYGGEAVQAEKPKRWSPDELRRVRDRQIYVMRIQGVRVIEIAEFFSLTRFAIYKIIAAIPASEKRRIERSHHGSSRVA